MTQKNCGKKNKSTIEVFIHGDNLIFYEFYSKDKMTEIISVLEHEYGVVCEKKCRSMCG